MMESETKKKITRGHIKWMIPELQSEIMSIMEENKFNGHGAESKAQVKVVEYCQVGRKAEVMLKKITLGLYREKKSVG